ncbi:serine/threonine protein kinase-like protein [Amylocarpus encephaloides]|uniref:Serine/threonine protein kinase-like protein n=1 Tax=Amylocarpus encephaloides TaxID=45428 RepID=A0A9P7Y916_9HELO|nr:serine/threonine protein kinase-like protein [Amylocarpus encephaloides]
MSLKSSSSITTTVPAVTNLVRDFHPPVPGSADEDSDYGGGPQTPRRHKLQDVVSANSSPMMRSSSGQAISGISKMRLTLETLKLENESGPRSSSMVRSRSQMREQRQHQQQPQPQSRSSTGTPSEGFSDDEASDITSYDIPLEHDFVSESVQEKPIFGAVEGGLVQDTIARKMTAGDFDPLRCLGKGTFGTVLLVKQQATGRLYAQKQFKKASLTVHKRLVEQTKTERSILESVNRHPFVVKLFYAFQDHEKLYLILEYAQGGELFTHLAQERMFTEEVASFYMAEMILALDHLHRNLGVIYRDLKPENCLLDSEGHLLLTDFGLSKVAVDEDDRTNSVLGTVEYMAPEVVLGQKYGMAVDWWSFGALGFDLLTGSPPFQGQNHAKIQQQIVKQKLVMPYFMSADAKDLLTRLLRKEPTKRLGAHMPKDLLTMRKHRFFRKIDWKKLANREVEPPIQPLITDPELAENFSADFTELALSPILTSQKAPWSAVSGAGGIEDPFAGFSYVASQSLLDGNGFPGMIENRDTAVAAAVAV